MHSEPTEYWAVLVPEFTVTDLEQSLRFYETLGFSVRFRRSNPPFAYLELGRAQIMLEQIHDDAWITGDLKPPFGRGINFQIEVEDVRRAAKIASMQGISLYEGLNECWYKVGNGKEEGQLEFLVQDPDGYLMRFVQPLGNRSTDA